MPLPRRPHPGVGPADEAAWPLAAPLHATVECSAGPALFMPQGLCMGGLCTESLSNACPPGNSSASKSCQPSVPAPGAPRGQGGTPARVVGSLHSAWCLAAAQEMSPRPWDPLPCSSEIMRLAHPAKKIRVGTGQDGAALTRQVGLEVFSPLHAAHGLSTRPHQAQAAPGLAHGLPISKGRSTVNGREGTGKCHRNCGEKGRRMAICCEQDVCRTRAPQL